MIKVKPEAKGFNVPFRGKTLGTLEGEDLKKYITAYLNSKRPDYLLRYFDNTLEELADFAATAPKKHIEKPKKDSE